MFSSPEATRPRLAPPAATDATLIRMMVDFERPAAVAVVAVVAVVPEPVPAAGGERRFQLKEVHFE